MGVYKINFRLWTNHSIPFECNDEWALKRIEDFNRAVGRIIFVTRHKTLRGHDNYVVFKQMEAADSVIGMQGGGPQPLNYKKTLYSIFHEMSHCVGLGHEYFHQHWPLRNDLLGICPCQTAAEMGLMGACPHNVPDKQRKLHKWSFLRVVNNYQSVGNYDAQSIMSYNPNNLGLRGQGGAPIPYNQPQCLSPGDAMLIRRFYTNALPF